MKNSIEVINLSKSYKTKKAVNNINFKINENEIVGLLGPNGCGKTTTIGMILGLLKPTSGQVLINGKNIENNKISILHKMNFISPYIELPKKLTVKQNLIVYGKLYNIKNLNNDYKNYSIKETFLKKNKSLMNCKFVLIHHSSAIFKAINFNKPIIQITSKKFNDFIKNYDFFSLINVVSLIVACILQPCSPLILPI